MHADTQLLLTYRRGRTRLWPRGLLNTSASQTTDGHYQPGGILLSIIKPRQLQDPHRGWDTARIFGLLLLIIISIMLAAEEFWSVQISAVLCNILTTKICGKGRWWVSEQAKAGVSQHLDFYQLLTTHFLKPGKARCHPRPQGQDRFTF